ncbi:MAG: EF-P lysine aminoacylase EpmA [bacterium]|nr:EF-P lysine aminoacylase EpmA [bacterium]
MRILSSELYEAHSQYLAAVRDFFRSRGYLEVETPLMNRQGAVELHLDSLTVRRRGIRKSPEAPAPPAAGTDSLDADPDLAGYLITSPEYNLKIVLSELQRSIFQVAHAFREGDIGQIHSEEFLMLEWYLVGGDEFALMDQCEEFLHDMCARPFSRIGLPEGKQFPRRSVSELLQTYADCADFSRPALQQALDRHGLLNPAERDRPDEIPYDDLFFSLFLNRVEEHLGVDGPEFVYDYPPALAALSRVEDGRARRFEIYWRRVELANGYFELSDGIEQRRRFDLDNRNRRQAGKPEMQPDPKFLAALDRGLPECSGIALGLDRLFMLLRDAESLAEVSMY